MKNTVDLIGNVGIEVKTTQFENGQVSNFSLATHETIKKQDGSKEKKTTWHNIVVFGKLSELAQKFIQKGDLINIIGKIQYREYEDKDNQKKYITEIVANKLIFLTPKGEQEISEEEN